MSITIQLVPIGPVPPEVMEFLQDRIATVLHASVVTGRQLPVPTWGFHRQRQQFNSSAILQWLQQVKSPVGTIVFAITQQDLYADSLRFVFGGADPQGKRALISLARLSSIDPGQLFAKTLLQERARQEAIHELGHVLGLPHCLDPRRVMWFSKGPDDTNVKLVRFCQGCADKLGAHLCVGTTPAASRSTTESTR